MDLEILLRFLFAAAWGGLVGIEREYRSKSAGFRTLIMISIGACFFTIISQYIGAPGSPDRIASNIVTGIGFLGAGVIFHGQNKISGITTAATIWAVAAVGMGIGAGDYFASGCASILILLVLAALPYAEKLIDAVNKSRDYVIECDYNEAARDHYLQMFQSHKLRPSLSRLVKTGDQLRLEWHVQGRMAAHEQFIRAVCNDPLTKQFEY